ncbi:unnamed protein product [Leuciscus chuanchicus]
MSSYSDTQLYHHSDHGAVSSGPAKGQATAERHERAHAATQWCLSNGPAMARWEGNRVQYHQWL